jgi:hypothetical protein
MPECKNLTQPAKACIEIIGTLRIAPIPALGINSNFKVGSYDIAEEFVT